jgi:hypothetical protein
MAGTSTTRTRVVLTGLALVLVCIGLVSLLPPTLRAAKPNPRTEAGLGSYDWPIRPFGRPHVVRAYVGDPRMGTTEIFHFGIDISTPKGTPVFAIHSGRVHLINGTAVSVASGPRTLQYWHLTLVVRDGSWVQRHALLGRTFPTYNHFHFSELVSRRYVNPLRQGGLTPFRDYTMPTTKAVSLYQGGRQVDPANVHGRVAIVADMFDTAGGVRPWPWPVTPALIRWRIAGREGPGPWHVVADFRRILPSSSLFASIFAPGTKPNMLGHPGRLRFFLAHSWSSTQARDGNYVLIVSAADMRANTGTARFPFTVRNQLVLRARPA